jgi:hypothetical protein
MNSATVASRLRGQIARFSGVLSEGLPKKARKFVGEMVYGIQARGSVRLTEVARAQQEAISLKKTQERLCRQLKRPGLGTILQRNLIRLASEHVTGDILLIVDIGDISKKYARRMEYLDRIRDGSEKELANGYWLCTVVATSHKSSKTVPIYNKLYSTKAKGFISENKEIEEAIEGISKEVGNRGTWVIDRGGDRRELFDFLMDRGHKFIVRLRGDRFLEHKNRPSLAAHLADKTKLIYSEYIVEEEANKERVKRIDFGYLKVKLPKRDDTLFLFVVRGFGEQPLMILTNEPLRRNRKVLLRILKGYIKRWEIEKTFRFIKQSYEIEDVRVLGYTGLQNIMVIVMAVAYFAMVVLDSGSKMKVMLGHIYRVVKRVFGIPDFRYYAIADGIMSLLTRHPGGVRGREEREERWQLTLGLVPDG